MKRHAVNRAFSAGPRRVSGPRLSRVLACSLLGLVLWCSNRESRADEGGNLLRNPGFEEPGPGGIAMGWYDNSSWAAVRVRYATDSENPHNGDSAQVIECTEFESGALQFAQGGLSLTEGEPYFFSVWARGDVTVPVEILIRRRAHPYTVYMQGSFVPGAEWAFHEFTSTCPITDAEALFMIRFAAQGRLIVDDAVVRSARGAKSPLPKPPGNMVRNSSFELGDSGWGSLVREKAGYEHAPPIEFEDVRPTIDRTGAPHGNASLRVAIPEKGRWTLTSRYMRLRYGHPYSVSLYAKVEGPGMVLKFGLVGGVFNQEVSFETEALAGMAWKRFEHTCVLTPVEDSAYFFRLSCADPGKMWVDAIQVEEGETTSYRPWRQVEAGLKIDEDPRICTQGKVVPIVFMGFNAGPGGRRAAYRLVVQAHQDQNLMDEEFGAILPQGRVSVRRFLFQRRALGSMRALLYDGETDQVLDEALFGTVPLEMPRASENSPFGHHIRFNRFYFETARRTGVHWVRLHPPMISKWFILETEPGEWQWFDDSLRLAKGNKLFILGSLDTTPRWASSAPEEMTHQVHSGFRSYPARDLADWRHYVKETVTRYKPWISDWEVWNEPDISFFHTATGDESKPQEYVALLKEAYQAAKEADPDCRIVGGCSAQWPPLKWLQKVIDAGGLDWMDVISFHHYPSYRQSPEECSPPLAEAMEELRTAMREAGKEVPIWNTEGGIVRPGTAYQSAIEPGSSGRVSAKDAADYIVRAYVENLAAGVERYFYYSMQSSNLIHRNDYTSLLEYDRSPRPALLAYGIMVTMLDGADYVGPVEMPDDVVAHGFEKEGAAIVVLWRSDDSPRKYLLPFTKGKDFQIRSLMGNLRGFPREKGAFKANIGRSPLYAIERKKTPGESR